MDLDFNPEEQAFRDEVRQFLATALPADIRDRMSRDDASHIREDIVRWQKILHAKGWGAPAWPVEFGGTGWSKTQQYLFETECALADAPAQLAFGIKMVAPVIMRYGSAEQQQRFLPRILAGRGLVVPGLFGNRLRFGPGLAEDEGRARRRRLRAQRPARSGTRWASSPTGSSAWCAPIRHAKPQKGISFLLIDMKTPGITVRPTRLLDGTLRSQRDLVRRRARAGRQPRRRREPGLDLRQVPARPRTHQHRRHRRIQARTAAAEAGCAPRCARTAQPAARIRCSATRSPRSKSN